MVVALVGVVLVAVAHIATSEAFCNLYCVVVIAEPKGEASNRDVLSSPVCIYVCMYNIR